MDIDAPVGILGLGLVGTAFAERLIGAGISVIGFDIDRARREILRANGGTVVASARDLASRSRAIVIAVYSDAQVEEALADLENNPARPALICNRTALAEGIVLAERMGLDGPTFLAIARDSAAYSRVMDSKGEKMLNRDFRPQSHISQTLKDAELILEEAARHHLHLPVTEAQAGLLRATIAIEGPGSDSAAIIEAVRQRNAPAGGLR